VRAAERARVSLNNLRIFCAVALVSIHIIYTDEILKNLDRSTRMGFQNRRRRMVFCNDTQPAQSRVPTKSMFVRLLCEQHLVLHRHPKVPKFPHETIHDFQKSISLLVSKKLGGFFFAKTLPNDHSTTIELLMLHQHFGAIGMQVSDRLANFFNLFVCVVHGAILHKTIKLFGCEIGIDESRLVFLEAHNKP
jgi:hypothetical protein